MYQAADGTELLQSEIFLQYHTDLAQFNRPRLPAVEFFKVCESVYPGVTLEQRVGTSAIEPAYVIMGMSHRQVRSHNPPGLLIPRATSVATLASLIEEEEIKEPGPRYADKDAHAEVQSLYMSPFIHLKCHRRFLHPILPF